MANAVINRSTSGAGTALVAGVAGKRIKVYSYERVSGGTVNVKFQHGDGVTQTDFEGAIPLIANSGTNRARDKEPIWITAAGAGLYLNLSGNVQVSGSVTYVQE